MEKRRIRYFRFVTPALFLGFLWTSAAAQSSGEAIVEIQVNVESPLKEGDRAGSVESARQEAFKKAVEMTLPPGIEEADRAARLKNPSAYIKSYRTLSEVEEAGVVKLTLLCQVIQVTSSPEAQPTYPAAQSIVRVEMLWRPGVKPYLASEIMRVIEEEYQSRVQGLRMQYGSLVLEIASSRDPQTLFGLLATRYQDRALMKLVDNSSSTEWPN